MLGKDLAENTLLALPSQHKLDQKEGAIFSICVKMHQFLFWFGFGCLQLEVVGVTPPPPGRCGNNA